MHFIVYDRVGLYTYIAERLGRDAAQVDYYIPDAEAYPTSAKAEIGRGLPEIKRINDKEFHANVEKADMIYFPDCYDGEKQTWYRSKGYRVGGGGKSERFEIDKWYFIEAIEKAGLCVPETMLTKGIDDLLECLKAVGVPRWLKGLMRGDFETKKYTGMNQFENWLAQYLLPMIGQKRKDIKILVQEQIEADCEPGLDRFVADGRFTQQGLVGYEDKDKGIVECFMDELPAILTDIDDACAIYLKDARQHYSTEVRINKEGAWFTDPTVRVPSPPGELMTEMVKDYPVVIYQLSGGEVPTLSANAKYGVEIILTSAFYEKHEICVEFPEKMKKHIKLKNHCKRGDAYYCIPNQNGAFFGAVVAWGDDWKKAAEEAQEIAREIVCDELEYGESTFEKAERSIEAGKKYGVSFT
jgi:hypothetical protein